MNPLFLMMIVASVFGTPSDGVSAEEKRPETLSRAIFAGGCFWCMQPPFDKLDGVVSTTVGYTGGARDNPTYEEVCSGSTGHAEAVLVEFDPSGISYDALLDVFWRNIDPTTPNRQFADAGSQYRTAIFFQNENQKARAEASKENLMKSGKFGNASIVTEIVPAQKFWPAEDYHQKYYEKNFSRYKLYRKGSGREDYLKKVWGDDG